MLMKPEGQKTDQQLPGAGVKGDNNTKGYMGIFWVDESILYLDCGCGYRTIYVCQSSQNCTPKNGWFTVCKLNFNNPMFFKLHCGKTPQSYFTEITHKIIIL